MKRYIITAICAMGALIAGAQAHDNETYCFEGRFTAKSVGPSTYDGLRFWIKSLDPYQALIMGVNDIEMTGRPEITGDFLPPSNEYENFPSAGYSGVFGKYDLSSVEYEGCSYSVTGIAYGAFANCTELISVELPMRINLVCRGAFYGCTALQEVTQTRFPPKRNENSEYWCTFFPDIFKGCTNLVKADISVADYVWDGIFADCPALEEVKLTTSGNQLTAFRGRNVGTLKRIICCGDNPGTGKGNSFFSEEEFATTDVTVPAGALDAYRAHPVWGRFANLHE